MTEPHSEEIRTTPDRHGRATYLIALVALVVLGGGLRVYQFSSNPSLWIDEAAIARNVYDQSLITLLTKPLNFEQTAPKGFLVAEKAAVWFLGETDYALRVFPFFCSLAALLIFARLANRVLPPAGALTATALFVFAAPLLYFTTQAKQYAGDVFASTCFLLLACIVYDGASRNTRSLCAVAGALLPWISQPAAFVAVAVAGTIALSASATHRRDTYKVVGVWLFSSVGALLVALATVTPETREYLYQYWIAGFPPVTWAQQRETWWPWNQVRMLIGTGAPGFAAVLAYPQPTVYAVCGGVGLWLLARERGWAACLLATPAIIVLGAAVARQYPFSDRLIVFLLPNFFLALGACAAWLLKGLSSRLAVVVLSLAMVVPAAYPVLRMPPPYQNENLKPVLAFVESHRLERDRVYVYYGAVPAVDVYTTQLHLDPVKYSAGSCYSGNTRRYLEELDTFRGESRVWVVITHALPLYREREDLLAYLDTIGTRQAQFAVPPRRIAAREFAAEGFLYDLSDTSRLARASFTTFPVSGAALNARLGCGQGPQAMTPSHLRKIKLAH